MVLLGYRGVYCNFRGTEICFWDPSEGEEGSERIEPARGAVEEGAGGPAGSNGGSRRRTRGEEAAEPVEGRLAGGQTLLCC